MTTLTGSNAASLLRTIIKDYNYWGEGEGDSPLSVKRTKGIVDDKKILSLDASARKKAAEQPVGYKPPTRTIRTETVDNVFRPLINNACLELFQKKDALAEGGDLTTLMLPAEAVEYYVQLSNCFSQLSNPKVCYVEDSSDPYTGVFILGESADSETVYVHALLVQT